MDIVLGIDIGGSNTKLAALDLSGSLQSSLLLKNGYGDLDGVVSRFLGGKGYSVSEIALTGVGSRKYRGGIIGAAPFPVNEFTAIGLGGLSLSGLSEAVVASMGTGTTFVYGKDGVFEHIIGTGVGGGTLLGLCGRLAGATDIECIEKIAQKGDFKRVDLTVGEVAEDLLPSLSLDLAAANFAAVKADAGDADWALGVMNLILQVVGTMSILACRSYGVKDVVLTGAMTEVSLAEPVYRLFTKSYAYNFSVPPHAAFATAAGAALQCMRHRGLMEK